MLREHDLLGRLRAPDITNVARFTGGSMPLPPTWLVQWVQLSLSVGAAISAWRLVLKDGEVTFTLGKKNDRGSQEGSHGG